MTPSLSSVPVFHCPCSRDLSPTTTTMLKGTDGNSLPNEILGSIFDYLSRDALTRVALVSRRWRANAERILYSAIVIHEVLPRASPAIATTTVSVSADNKDLQRMLTMPAVPVTTLRCCDTLSARPRLAEYVRRFHLRWETDAVESPLLLLRIAHNIARTLVPTLVHLHSLELSFGLAAHFSAAAALSNYPPLLSLQSPLSPPSPSLPPHAQKPHTTQHQQLQQQLHLHLHLLLPPINLPSLRTLSLHGIGTPPTPDLERILRLHPTLLHLRLSDHHRALRLSPTDVPRLRSFRGYPATAASLLPGRPVQVLGLVGGELATEAQLARMAEGSLPVRALDLSGLCATPTLLRSVSRHLSHLEWLKVRLALRHTLHHALPGIRLLTALTTVLAAFYNLRGLDLSPTNAVVQHPVTASVAASNALEEEHLCVTWMGACPSLRRIVFPSQTEWSLAEAGTWISGSQSESRSSSPGSLPRWSLVTPTRVHG